MFVRSRVLLVAVVVSAALAVAVTANAESAGGYDVADCSPSPEHPNPVVLIHGFGAPEGSGFRYLGPQLASQGYCAYAVAYGSTFPTVVFGGLGPMDDSADHIAAFIADVLDRTDAEEVDIIGHSEGGLHSLYVPKKHQLGDQVRKVIAIAPPTHGLDASGTLTVARTLGLPPLVKPLTSLFGCTACDELVIDEDFFDRLHDGPVTQVGIDYTIIASNNDRIVTPYETSFVDEPGVDNILWQDLCPLDAVGHIGLATDPGIADFLDQTLAGRDEPVECGFGPPV